MALWQDMFKNQRFLFSEMILGEIVVTSPYETRSFASEMGRLGYQEQAKAACCAQTLAERIPRENLDCIPN